MKKVIKQGGCWPGILNREAPNALPAVRTEGDALLPDSPEINKSFRDFYAALYSSAS